MANRTRVTEMTYIAIFAALTGVLSYIIIPVQPVPITLQTLGVMLAGSVLTARQSAMSMFVFLFLGAVGIPVFSGGTAGVGMIVGKTGGYLVGFLAGAAVISLIRGKSNKLWRLAIANILGGIVVVDIFGLAWLSHMVHVPLVKAFMLGALPFIPGDLAKAAAATLIGHRLNKYLMTRR